MKHFANPSFWDCYNKLPLSVQELADKNFKIMKRDHEYSSLHLKTVGSYLSVRIGRKYRALAVEIEDGAVWFWIGTHAEYDRLIKRKN